MLRRRPMSMIADGILGSAKEPLQVGFLFLVCLFLAAATVEAASLSGKWTGPKGGVVQCSDTECKVAEGKQAGAVVLKDINVNDGKGTAKMQVKKGQWVDMKVDVGDKEMTLTGPKGKSIKWTRAE